MRVKLFQNWGKKIINCPHCKKRLRVPAKVSRPIEVSCPYCTTKFRVEFRSSLAKLFEFKKDQNIWQKFIQFFKNFRKLAPKAKLFLLSIGIFVLWVSFACILFLNS